MATLLGGPRAWAHAQDSRWSRNHTLIGKKGLVIRMRGRAPTCVAVLDPHGSTTYSDHQSFLVFDVDIPPPDDEAYEVDGGFEAAWEEAKACTVELATSLVEDWYCPVLITFSGSKGFHIWVWLTHPLVVEVCSDFQRLVLANLGYEEGAEDRHQSATHEHYTKGWVTVDTLIRSGQGGIIKIPFVKHQARQGFYEIPVPLDQVMTWDRDQELIEDHWAMAFELVLEVPQVPSERIVQQIPERPPDSVVLDVPTPTQPVTPRRPRRQQVQLPFQIPLSTHRQGEIHTVIQNTPCLKRCFDIATGQRGIYYERVALVVALVRAGYSREDIGAYFKNRINDATDNAKVGVLEQQINYWSKPDIAERCARCERFQSTPRESNFGGKCPLGPGGNCGRPFPGEILESDVLVTSEIPEPRGLPLMDMAREYLSDGIHRKLFKATRAGVTTSTAIMAVMLGKKAIIVEPTTALCGPKAKEIAEVAKREYNVDIKVAVFEDNRKACLILKQMSESLNQRFATLYGESVAFDELEFVPKPACVTCRHFNDPNYSHFTIVPGQPIGDSDPQERLCAHSTIVNNLEEFDLIFMTYPKLNALIKAAALSRLNEQVLEALEGWNVCVLDEISSLTDNPSMTAHWDASDMDGDVLGASFSGFSFKDLVLNEINYLKRHLSSRTIPRMERMAREAVDNLEALRQQMDEPFFDIGDVLKDQYDVAWSDINFGKMWAAMVNIAMKENKLLPHLSKTIQMLGAEDLFSTNIPTLDYSRLVNVNRPPAVENISQWLSMFEGQIIATDATMPIVDLDPLFGLRFDAYNVGDPRNSNELCRMFPDFRNVNSNAMFNDEWLLDQVKIYLKWYQLDDGIIVVPSKKAHDWLRTRLIRNQIPLPHDNLTYVRSDRTIGVDCDSRVMLFCTQPRPPADAFTWLKHVYPNILSHYTPLELVDHDTQRWVYQTASRAKDPSNQETSAILMAGISTDVCRQLMNPTMVVEPIPVVSTHSLRSGSNILRWESTVIRSKLWKEKRLDLRTDTEQKALMGLMLGKSNREMQRSTGVQMNYTELDRLRGLLDGLSSGWYSPPNITGRFGL